MKIFHILFLIFIFLSTFFSTAFSAPALLETNPSYKNKDHYLGLPLETGYLIVSESNLESDYLFTLAPEIFTPYTHIGIISVEKTGAYVLEVKAYYSMGFGNKPPTDTLKGSVSKTPLAQYIANYEIVSVFAPPPSLNKSALMTYARQQLANRTPYDAYFDADNSVTLYCSEYVANALQSAGYRGNVAPRRTIRNQSVLNVLTWMKVKANFFITTKDLLLGHTWVGTRSQKHSRSDILINRAVKYDFYRRFTQDQKVGNILSWSLLGLKFMPEAKAFMEKMNKSTKLRQTSNVTSLYNNVSTQANQAFGKTTRPYRGAFSPCDIAIDHCVK